VSCTSTAAFDISFTCLSAELCHRSTVNTPWGMSQHQPASDSRLSAASAVAAPSSSASLAHGPLDRLREVVWQAAGDKTHAKEAVLVAFVSGTACYCAGGLAAVGQERELEVAGLVGQKAWLLHLRTFCLNTFQFRNRYRRMPPASCRAASPSCWGWPQLCLCCCPATCSAHARQGCCSCRCACLPAHSLEAARAMAAAMCSAAALNAQPTITCCVCW